MDFSVNLASLEAMIPHIFLPPKLPEGADTENVEPQLVKMVRLVLQEFALLSEDPMKEAVAVAAEAIKNLQTVTPELASIDGKALRALLQTVAVQDCIVPVYVEQQNAAVIVRNRAPHVVFETFEISPRNSDAMSTMGRLRREFPGSSIAVPLSIFREDDFQEALSDTLAKMSNQPVPDMVPRTNKAGGSNPEDRDTIDPNLVSSLLASFLLGHGGPAGSTGVSKNTREEVSLSSGHKLPWRRSPIWLLVRVTLQLTLAQRSPRTLELDAIYKRFMIFFMAQVQNLGLNHDIETDLIYCMNAKIAQRHLKLRPEAEELWLRTVTNIVTKATTQLSTRWSDITVAETETLETSHVLHGNIERELVIDLPELDHSIRSIKERTARDSASSFDPTSDFVDLSVGRLPVVRLFPSKPSDQAHNLIAVESWVGSNLAKWSGKNMGASTVCSMVYQLIQDYHKTAVETYKGSPEGLSTMLLTILELWIVCDKSAVQGFPLLAQYSPAIPTGIWEALLIRRKKDMERLQAAETYIRERTSPTGSIFAAFDHPSSFAVRFFDNSPYHKNLKAKIEQQARIDRDAKCTELARLQGERRNKLDQAKPLDCEYITYTDRGSLCTKHHWNCSRCLLEQQAKEMEISVHEWPLPERNTTAKATVFELALPPELCRWRDCTLYLINDVLASEHESSPLGDPTYTLLGYDGLSEFREPQQHWQRITLASKEKSFNRSHYREVKVSIASKANVCLNNGLRWKLYDQQALTPIEKWTGPELIYTQCTFKLPAALSKQQKFLHRPHVQPGGPPPNHVIAEQHACPYSMPVDEYKELFSMLLGHRIQWMNILRQLAMPTVDWKRPETTLVVWQMTGQAGPLNHDWYRASHSILQDADFVSKLTSYLEPSLARIKENWESSLAVTVLSNLATQVLFLGNSSCSNPCRRFLAECRAVCLQWLKVLREKANNTTEESQRTTLMDKQHEIALTCAGCFCLDWQDTQHVFRDSEILADFLQCSITIQETARPSDDEEVILRTLTLRWRRVMHALRKSIKNSWPTAQTSQALDIAVSRRWEPYSASSTSGWCWITSCWVGTQASTGLDGTTVPLHLNLLTAELRVNGLPLSRLPSEYEDHVDYQTLFGNYTLECSPSSEPGMTLQAGRRYKDHELHFSLQDIPGDCSKKDMLLTAVSDRAKLELLPSRVFRTRLPRSFASDFVHWYCPSTGSVTFRPKSEPWKDSSQLWMLHPYQGLWQLRRFDGTSLVSPASLTAKRCATIFGSLEDASGLHDIGTLVGLKNKLVLCRNGEASDSLLVLVPEGKVSFRESGTGKTKHVNAFIDSEASKVQPYQVNRHLGILEGSGSLQSKLFLAYLHALTSYAVPDPLTAQTGTERALSVLRGEDVRSFDVLSVDNAKILKEIAKLTPKREYYPGHLAMQRASWFQSLWPLSQHNDFFTEVQNIFSQATATAFLYPWVNYGRLRLDGVNSSLLKRDNIRASTFRIHGFGAEHFSSKSDVVYPPRDKLRGDESTRVHRICAAMLRNELPRLKLSPEISQIDLVDMLWSVLENDQGTKGPYPAMDVSELQYDGKWLDDHSNIFPTAWCRVHSTLQERFSTMNQVQLRIWISSLAFTSAASHALLQVLVAIAVRKEIRAVYIPTARDFFFEAGTDFKASSIKWDVEQEVRSFHNCPELNLIAYPWESFDQAESRRRNEYERNKSQSVRRIVNCITNQWPATAESLRLRDVVFSDHVNCRLALQNAKARFEKWNDNIAFKKYLTTLAEGTKGMKLSPNRKIPQTTPVAVPIGKRASRTVDISTVFHQLAPPPVDPVDSGKDLERWTIQVSAPGMDRLQQFLDDMKSQPHSRVESRYLDSLSQSAASLRLRESRYELMGDSSALQNAIVQHAKNVRAKFSKGSANLLSLLRVSDPNSHGCVQPQLRHLQLAAATHQWPRWSTRLLLEQLSQRPRKSLSSSWKHALVKFAKNLEGLQWSERLVALRDRDADLVKELRNHGPDDWDSQTHLDTLLLEIQANVRVRSVQGEIANMMREPPKGQNAVMQLNMGEGKSSVIIPIVALSLADGDRLVRVIVAKPQSRQMYEMLLFKLGGLVNRRIYHLPFSRATQLSNGQAKVIHRLLNECVATGGILLVQPEHLLSLQLMTIESFIREEDDLGKELLQIWTLFRQLGRDLVDESDENFSPKFELVYTIGQQQPIDFADQRWKVIQEVLEIVVKAGAKVTERKPKSIEMEPYERGTFPRMRILDDEGRVELLETVASRVCEKNLTAFPVARHPPAFRRSVKTYIAKPDLSNSEIKAVEESPFWNSTAKYPLLLLRGLLARGVLAFALGNKRWRVNYGLDASRAPETKLAVPYRAKDSPSARSEFSHPDAVIILTCLSYYWGGMSDDELFTAMEWLQKSDQAAEEYQTWTSSTDRVSTAFQSLEGVNLRDEEQCRKELFPGLKKLKGPIDYFLSNIVFTKEMREFPHKISASGWDIGSAKTQPMTGFSGTNDSQHLLPVEVVQLDLERQRHTNALVLDHLLNPANDVMVMPRLNSQSSDNGKRFIQTVCGIKPATKVILDVGAQIIDLDNHQVASAWLAMTTPEDGVDAVVFCNKRDELSVLDRDGRAESLQISPFNKKLDACAVFLDEAHTRGIDLHLPTHYRAAVTLGVTLTKDRLVQACMRMRKLGAGQTVVFCVPSEVELKIRALMPQPRTQDIEVAHVLRWAIEETFIDLARYMPIWATQGRTFVRQRALWDPIEKSQSPTMDKSLAEKFLDGDAPNLETRYHPRSGPAVASAAAHGAHCNTLDRITQRCEEFEVRDLDSATLHEEQERELEPEIEQERQVERPPAAKPHPHELHPKVLDFVQTGIIRPTGGAFCGAFMSLANTTAARKFDLGQFPRGLRATRDFANTVMDSGIKDSKLDAFQRDVRWVLTAFPCGSRNMTEMVLVSPYEADQLIDRIPKGGPVRLHMYAPRQSKGFAPIDHLALYTVHSTGTQVHVPPLLRTELNLFAGQLYFSSYEEYTQMCDYLDLSWTPTREGASVRSDGFIEPRDRGANDTHSGFQDSPVPFMQILMASIRRHYGGIERTHVGKVLEGLLLSHEDFAVEPLKQK